MASKLKAKRYKIEMWMDDAGEVEDEAFAYPFLTRDAAGAMNEQEQKTPVKFTPSAALKAALKSEQKAAVDPELAK